MGTRRGRSSQRRSERPPAKKSRKLILVVEGDERARNEICALLDANGHDAISAWTGREALGILAALRAPPALVVVDLESLGVPVATFREWPKTRAALRGIPLLVIAAAADASRSIEAEGFLAKPFERAALAALVETLTS